MTVSLPVPADELHVIARGRDAQIAQADRGQVRRAVARIAASDMEEMVVTDTIPLSEEARACPRIRQLSCAQLIAETITRISNEESVSSLFVD